MFTKETYLSVADSLFIINYEMMEILKASGNFLPRMHGSRQGGVSVFHSGNSAFAEAVFLLALAWPLM